VWNDTDMLRTVLGISADDLTGAADAAAALARPGASVAISLDIRPPTAKDERAAFAVTTNSRSLPPQEVFDLVADSASHLRMGGASFVFQKLDSNLRGNVGATVAALLDIVGGPVLLAPAFPLRGRTTVNATAFVDGVPVAETEMGRDPEAPVRHSHLPALLAEQWRGLTVTTCPLAVVRAGASAIRARLEPHAVIVADAETDADLDLLAEAVLMDPPLRAAAGSGGLAAALARRLYGPRPARTWPEERQGPVLAVLASSSHTLAVQVAHADTMSDATVVPFPCERLNWDEQPVPVLNAAIAAAVAALTNGKDTVIHAAGPLPKVEHPVDLVVEHLAHLGFVAVKQGSPSALLLGGGATAHEVLGVLGTRAVEIDDEPLTGIAAGTISGGEMAARPVVLKPGAAGGERAVVELLDYLRRRATLVETDA